MVLKKYKLSAVFSLVFVILLGGIFAANFVINTNNRAEFGQGATALVTCDTHINIKLIPKLDLNSGDYFIDQVVISDISVQLHDKRVDIFLRDVNGAQLNSDLHFNVGSDGITFTSSRIHVDSIDAFSTGEGPNGEKGTSQVTFTNFSTEEPNKILTNDVKNMTLSTSGLGSCSVPSNTAGIGLYVDAPYVQGSYVAETYSANSLTDTFNSITTDNSNCPSSGSVGTYSGNDCKVLLSNHNGSYPYGGAITTSSTPTTGGVATSQSASAGVFTSAGESITFSSSKNYIGFWWSAGSTGNSVEFYRNNVLQVSMTGDDVYNKIPKNSTKLTALDGTTQYTKSNYYGHPLSTSTMDAGEPFVYFHCFALNGLTFDKIKIKTTGNGFEFDNLTVANLSGNQLTPKNTLVSIGNYNVN